MSARKAAIALKPEARRDIEDILIYSAEQWGLEQRDAYRDEIRRAIEILRGNPFSKEKWREEHLGIGEPVRQRLAMRQSGRQDFVSR